MSFRQIHPGLPIFCFNQAERSLIYTAGHAAPCSSEEAREVETIFLNESARGNSRAAMLAGQLVQSASAAVTAWKNKLQTPFEPECLTIHFSNRCSLHCAYCYALSDQRRQDRPLKGKDLPEITAEEDRGAARLVARNCSKKSLPLRVVLHGGGEPTVHWQQVQRVVEITRQVADQYRIGWWCYLATNGMMSAHQVRWAAEHLDLIGLSCDGPPGIQDVQRPLADGRDSSARLERTAQILAETGAEFIVRATITPQTLERQAEIAGYLAECLGARQMRFEPVFRIDRADQKGFTPQQAEWFVEHFLAAQKEAARRGCQLDYSGVRMDEIHGPFCDVLRDVLRLVPAGLAAACFLGTEAFADTSQSMVIGHFDREIEEFVLDPQRIAAQRRRLGQIPDPCRQCINIYHCARHCPEVCLAEAAGLTADKSLGFRCRVNRKLAEAWLLEAAGLKRRAARCQHSINSHREKLYALLNNIPGPIDTKAVVRQWHAVKSLFPLERRSLPPPIWRKRSFEHDGKAAWQHLVGCVSGKKEKDAISIYIHVPFCDRRCRFCDCYSMPLGRKERHEEQGFVQALIQEIDHWSSLPGLGQRPVTTIHFGGGTPNYLSEANFSRILQHCRERLGITAQTEWALESTSSLLDAAHLKQLQHQGFSRLHVGVQTLEEEVRGLIGRKEPADQVLEKLACALEMGFVVSVDLIYGLPQQTAAGLVATLERLLRAGVHGFSLYQLHLSSSFRRFLKHRGTAAPDSLFDYILFQVAEQILIKSGCRKNHFTHFARAEDTNLYYTHGSRGEDLLALGPTADGVFADYHYRHAGIEDYTAGNRGDHPGLEGGLRETLPEQTIRPALTALMSGTISCSLLQDIDAGFLLKNWCAQQLLEETPGPGQFTLTANGSWFITHMIEQLCEWVKARGAFDRFKGS